MGLGGSDKSGIAHGAADTPPALLFRSEPWRIGHALILALLALSAAPLWLGILFAPAVAFVAPPLLAAGALALTRRRRRAAHAAYVQARLAETISTIADPDARAAEAAAAWAASPRNPAASAGLFWIYAALGLLNGLALAVWTVSALGWFGLSGAIAAAAASAAALLYAIGFAFAAQALIGALVSGRPLDYAALRANAPDDDAEAAACAAELRTALAYGQTRINAASVEAVLLAVSAAAIIAALVHAGHAPIDPVLEPWAPIGAWGGGFHLSWRDWETPMMRARLAIGLLLGAIAAFAAVLIVRPDWSARVAALAGAVAAADAWRAAGRVAPARTIERNALRAWRSAAPVAHLSAGLLSVGLIAVTLGLMIAASLTAPGLAIVLAGIVIVLAVWTRLEQMRQALLSGQSQPPAA
jgi:hypothetical protein